MEWVKKILIIAFCVCLAMSLLLSGFGGEQGFGDVEPVPFSSMLQALSTMPDVSFFTSTPLVALSNFQSRIDGAIASLTPTYSDNDFVQKILTALLAYQNFAVTSLYLFKVLVFVLQAVCTVIGFEFWTVNVLVWFFSIVGYNMGLLPG